MRQSLTIVVHPRQRFGYRRYVMLQVQAHGKGIKELLNKSMRAERHLSPLVLFVSGYLMWRNRRKTKGYKALSRKLDFNSAALGRDK